MSSSIRLSRLPCHPETSARETSSLGATKDAPCNFCHEGQTRGHYGAKPARYRSRGYISRLLPRIYLLFLLHFEEEASPRKGRVSVNRAADSKRGAGRPSHTPTGGPSGSGLPTSSSRSSSECRQKPAHLPGRKQHISRCPASPEHPSPV